jgi:hypothetical protein
MPLTQFMGRKPYGCGVMSDIMIHTTTYSETRNRVNGPGLCTTEGYSMAHPQSTCSIPDCSSLAARRGLCRAHYYRLRTYGDPLAGGPFRPAGRSLEDRFWSKVDKNGPVVREDLGPCWIFTGRCNSDGYGGFYLDGHTVNANRVAYVLTYGPLDPSLEACHHCDNPPCVRPTHLFPGTQLDNVRDCIAKGRARKATGDANGSRLHRDRMPRGDSHPARLHPERVARGERNGHARLTAEQVEVIRAAVRDGTAQPVELAKAFEVWPSTIWHVIKGRTWKPA